MAPPWRVTERECGCPLKERSAGTHEAGVIAVSPESISLSLTSEQVEMVIADVAARAGCDVPLSVVMSPAELLASPLLEDQTFSRSLLYGLLVLSCLSEDGSERRIREIAQELDLPDETARRYVYTLRAVGLLEQDPKTHKYRLAG